MLCLAEDLPMRFCFGIYLQEMLGGNYTRVGNGGVRTVFLAEYEGRKLAVKTLNDKKRLAQHHREVVTLDAVSLHTWS